MTIVRPFSPPIGRYKIPQNLINDLNNYVEEVLKDRNKTQQLDFGKNLVGEVTQELLISESFLNKGLLAFLGHSVENYIKLSSEKQIHNFSLISAWIVRQFKNEYNPIHWHSGHISGVGYLKVPKAFGENIKKDKENVNGSITFIHGSKMFLCGSKISYSPKVGDFYIFPNYMMHSVWPFNQDGERRCFSFNANIDDEIYNAYN